MVLPEVTAETALAQDATPQSTPASKEPAAAAASTVQFTHPEKVYFYLPGFQDESLKAGVYALDVAQYQAIKSDFAAAARGAAEALLADAAFAAMVDRLPFAPGSLVAVIGESDTDDLQSWFEILRYLLELRRPQDGIQLVNLAISGQPTTVASGQLMVALAQKPDWILCGLGGNDAIRSGLGATKTVVSIAETELNLKEMRRLAAAQSDAEWVWLTRWSIDEARIAAYPVSQMAQFALSTADLDAVSEVVLQQPEPVVDLTSVLGRPPDPALLREDGLHPSLAGHTLFARAVVERLTA
jgi:lysophospholipase L1-like esterase